MGKIIREKAFNRPSNNWALASKIHTRFQTWPLRNNMSLLLRLERKQKAFVKSLSNSHIHLELKHTLRSSLKNHTRFQTKMGKVYTRFQTEKAHKPWPVGKPGLDSTLDWTGLDYF